ncbi:MAG: thiamine diphosphokinase [Bacteroidia bacterium]|nr:thiamine diphosphokinase [Bacteroidia bacterium]MCZ2140801.1 thiamine diphosphokinase [Bacteroidia bacterium]
MTSHAIVKDNQEPALIIANGETCSMEIIGQLLEWNPYVVVLDGAITRVLELGIKIDVLLGDFDSKSEAFDKVQKQQKIEIVHTPNQDKTDLQKGIEFLIGKGFSAVNIIWATGKRADHNLSNITDIVRYQNKIKIVLYDNYSKIFQLPKQFKKWYNKNTPISLMPVGKVMGVTSTGLSYDLTDMELNLGYKTSSSNSSAHDGIVTISHQQGDLLLMECND